MVIRLGSLVIFILAVKNIDLVQINSYLMRMISYEERLRAAKLSVTAQRIAVMKEISAHPHCTADDLLQRVTEKIGSISKQAVYDIIHLLTEKELIRRIQPSGCSALYEDRVGDNHHHLICRNCRKTCDVDCATGKKPCLHASDDHGFIIDEAEVIYWGICPDCQ